MSLSFSLAIFAGSGLSWHCHNSPVLYVDTDGRAIAQVAGLVIGTISAAALAKILADYLELKGAARWAFITAVTVAGAALGTLLGPIVEKLSATAIAAINAKIAAATSVVAATASEAAQKWGNLSQAAQYGIKAYTQMVSLLKNTGLQAHHIIEQRFGLNIDISVAVTLAEHQAFTNAWRSLVPYGTDYSVLTPAQIWNYAQEVYKNFPVILDAAKKALGFKREQ